MAFEDTIRWMAEKTIRNLTDKLRGVQIHLKVHKKEMKDMEIIIASYEKEVLRLTEKITDTEDVLKALEISQKEDGSQ